MLLQSHLHKTKFKGTLKWCVLLQKLRKSLTHLEATPGATLSADKSIVPYATS